MRWSAPSACGRARRLRLTGGTAPVAGYEAELANTKIIKRTPCIPYRQSNERRHEGFILCPKVVAALHPGDTSKKPRAGSVRIYMS